MEAPATQSPPEGADDGELKRMSFGDHLDELRRRVMLSLIAMGVCVLGMMPFKNWVTSIYVAPYRDMFLKGFVDYVDTVDAEVKAAGGVEAMAAEPFGELTTNKYRWLQKYQGSILDGTFPFEKHGSDIKNLGGYEVSHALIATKPIEDFWVFMAASFLFSLFLAGPFVLYQIWAFVAAGLYKTERSVVLKYLPGSAVLFLIGVSFGYFVVVPYGLYFLVKLMNFSQVQPMITVSTYFSLLFMLTAALGLAFQLPLIMLALQKIGVVTHEAFVKNWRYVILILVVAAAVFTPPDPFTQVMMAGPMVVLYVFGLFLTKRSARAAAAAAAASSG